MDNPSRERQLVLCDLFCEFRSLANRKSTIAKSFPKRLALQQFGHEVRDSLSVPTS
jgi:hypothetical protein